MELTNKTIYDLATELNSLQDLKTYIPIKANFFIQKNILTITAAAQEIEESRLNIAQTYGKATEESGQYSIPEDKREEALKELHDLFSIKQELDIKKISIDDLGNAEFTPAQMRSLMFMIEE